MLKIQHIFCIYNINAVICFYNDVHLISKIVKMSDIAIPYEGKNTPPAIDDRLAAYINSLIDIKIERVKKETQVGARFVTRSQIILEFNRRFYEKGVRNGFLNPIALDGRNAEHHIYRTEYEAYLRHLQLNRNNH